VDQPDLKLPHHVIRCPAFAWAANVCAAGRRACSSCRRASTYHLRSWRQCTPGAALGSSLKTHAASQCSKCNNAITTIACVWGWPARLNVLFMSVASFSHIPSGRQCGIGWQQWGGPQSVVLQGLHTVLEQQLEHARAAVRMQPLHRVCPS
jgi:hypothetical protein